jgi:acetyl esterase
VLVYFHGGGWVIGDLDTHDTLCRELANQSGCAVIAVDYRLAPEHRVPAAVDDAIAATRWIAANGSQLKIDPARLAVGGDSAGGNLAAVCAQQARDDDLALAAQLLVYPNTALLGDYPSRTENADGYFLTLADMRWFALQYTGLREDDPAAEQLNKDPRLSPLHAASLADLAPAVIATAEFDPLRDEGEAYAVALRDAGGQVTHRRFAGLIHGFYGMEMFSPAAADAMRWINARLKELLIGGYQPSTLFGS